MMTNQEAWLGRKALVRAAKWLSRDRVVRRRLPRRFGGDPLFVSPDAALRYLRPELDGVEEFRKLGDFAERYVRAGDVVWDVGVSMGVFAFAAASRATPAGFVLGFEPDVLSLTCVRRTMRTLSSPMARIEILPVAVSDSLGVETFHISSAGRAGNHLGRDDAADCRESVQVMTVPLDWVLERRPPPRVLKIDIEGAEPRLLAGAARVLAEAKPIILIEVFPQNMDTVTATLHAAGYRLHDYEAPGYPSVDRAVFNTVAIPFDR
jgi:FkbM family methyltransferase